jgi:hypothetical protein
MAQGKAVERCEDGDGGVSAPQHGGDAQHRDDAQRDDDAQREDRQFAAYMWQHFGIDPGDRPQTPSPSEPDEDEQFAAYMDRYFQRPRDK